MSVVHDSGVIMREDFENGNTIDPLIWSEMISGVISDQCGSVLHGKAGTFCDATGPRSLVCLLYMCEVINLNYSLFIFIFL